jgi:hypothetical protein
MPETPEELDSAVRMAAFAFLEDQLLEGAGETLPIDILRQGFTFRGGEFPSWDRREFSSPRSCRRFL